MTDPTQGMSKTERRAFKIVAAVVGPLLGVLFLSVFFYGWTGWPTLGHLFGYWLLSVIVLMATWDKIG